MSGRDDLRRSRAPCRKFASPTAAEAGDDIASNGRYGRRGWRRSRRRGRRGTASISSALAENSSVSAVERARMISSSSRALASSALPTSRPPSPSTLAMSMARPASESLSWRERAARLPSALAIRPSMMTDDVLGLSGVACSKRSSCCSAGLRSRRRGGRGGRRACAMGVDRRFDAGETRGDRGG